MATRDTKAADVPASSVLEAAIRRVDDDNLGEVMMTMMGRLFPICRSITGNGVRRTFEILQESIPLQIHEVPTGYKAFDWTVPREWNIRDAYVKNGNGERVIDFKETNLHVVGYSPPVARTMTLDELRPYLHTLPQQPDAIPYRTSYYDDQWGFCLSQDHLDSLADGEYEVCIDSSLEDGHLTFGDVTLPGSSASEILFSTYICHPSMANNELSGPIIAAMLCKILSTYDLMWTYRFVLVPETIGAVVYLSQHGEHLRQSLRAGYVVTCVGDAGPFTYKRSRHGSTIADKVAEHCLGHIGSSEGVDILDYWPGGSDERQYCSPGFDLPVGSLMRSQYATYPEYHTSLDNLDFVSAEGMVGTLKAYLRLIQVHELNQTYVNLSPYGEPQLSRRGLYSGRRFGGEWDASDALWRTRYLLAYSDGERDLVDIANLAGQPAWDFAPEIEALQDAKLIRVAD